MKISIVSKLRPRLFYGWWMIVAGFVIVTYGEGAHDYIPSQLFRLAVDEFGSLPNQAAFALSISGLVGAVTLLAIGPLIDRFGPRPLMLVGIPMVGIGYLGLSAAQDPILLYILQGTLIGVGTSAGFLLPVQTATANWFFKRRSMALALISAAPVVGGALTILLVQVIASQFPWRVIFLSLGLVMLAVGIPLALLIRHRPEQHGYLPDGQSAVRAATGETATEPSISVSEIIFTLRQALRTRAFWMLAIATVLGQGTFLIMRIFSHSLLTERGFPLAVASLSSSITPFTGLVGILLFGYLGDLFSKRHLLALAVAIQSFSVFILLIGGAAVQVSLYPLIFGLGSGTVPLILAIRADYFGRRAFATVTVATMLVSGIISIPVNILFPLMIGRLQDTVGSAVPGLLLSALIGLAAATIFLFVRQPEPPHPVSSKINDPNRPFI